jgi:hypothetical protein
MRKDNVIAKIIVPEKLEALTGIPEFHEMSWLTVTYRNIYNIKQLCCVPAVWYFYFHNMKVTPCHVLISINLFSSFA